MDNPTGESAAKPTTKPTGVEVEDVPQVSFEDGLGEVPQETDTARQLTDEPTTVLPENTSLDAIEIAPPRLDAIGITPPCQGMT